MKQKFIPLEKQSKRNQKAWNDTQRMGWGALNPVTRKTENGKAYNRKKSKQRWCEHDRCLDFCFVVLRRLPTVFWVRMCQRLRMCPALCRL